MAGRVGLLVTIARGRRAARLGAGGADAPGRRLRDVPRSRRATWSITARSIPSSSTCRATCSRWPRVRARGRAARGQADRRRGRAGWRRRPSTALARRAVRARGARIAAGLACALWPAGIAVASVTGTDMPAAALLAAAVVAAGARRRASVRWARRVALRAGAGARRLRARRRAAAGGAGRCRYWLRAWARPGCTPLTRTALACRRVRGPAAVGAAQSRRRYGEFFLTDSHGGHTALVGANPNTDGVYSRSLNRMFSEGTGLRAVRRAAPRGRSGRVRHRPQWTAFEPTLRAGPAGAPRPIAC